MAIEATRIYGRNKELFDAEALEMVESGELQTTTLIVARAVSEARRLTGSQQRRKDRA